MRVGVVLLSMLGACTQAQEPGTADPTPAIRRMLDASATAWNRGDLQAFLSDYAEEDETSFVSGRVVHYGYSWIRDNYAPRFEPGVARDSLRFEELASRPLGADHALATARYVLFRGDSVTSTGLFTLVLRRDGEDWKILHDHTSRDE